MKLKDDKTCHCRADASPFAVPCRFGHCMILRCPLCRLSLGDWGPVACPHKKNENGTLRWLKYPDTDMKKTHWGRKGDRRR